MTDTKLYGVWGGMKQRCGYAKHESYHNYGGKGIKLCESWNEFTNFAQWSLNNGYAEGMQIDRIDSGGNYEPSNCRWVNPKQQANNTSRNTLLTAFGECKTMTEWSEDPRCNVGYHALRSRIQNGWGHEAAIDTASNPPRRTTRWLEAFGERKAASEWLSDSRCKVGKQTLFYRLYNGWNDEDAITTLPDVCERLVEAFGEIKRLSDWSRDPRCKVQYSTLLMRIRRGWSPEAAITTPSRRES